VETPLLQTKLYIPQLQSSHIMRPGLIEKLNAGMDRKLILVAAPAGFGKTSILVEWLNQAERRVAWLSLEKADDDLSRFLNYLIAAIQGIEEGIGADIQAALRSAQPPPLEILLTTLVNRIADIDQEFTLILDDYQVITQTAIHEAVTFILEHIPPQMNMITSGRADPFLPLSRLRARGQMIELRIDDLRFSPQETAEYLNRMMGMDLAQEQIVALETRTEGWIAGLHLAALSMQGREDPAQLIAAFTGDDQYIIDYLVDEVLSQRPAGTQEFLLQTSILNRMCGSLCDAVTLKSDSQAVLTRLEDANLFIVPLDNRRRWYRYHRLFADLLRKRLDESASVKEIGKLHQRASSWYEENGHRIEAIDHALAASDFENAVRLIEEGATEFFASSRLKTLTTWWEPLPRDIVISHPKVCMVFAWAWLATGYPQEAENCLQIIESALGAGVSELFTEEDGSLSLTPEVRGALVEVAVLRAQIDIAQGHFAEALKLCRLILPDVEDDDIPYLFNSPADSHSVVVFSIGECLKNLGELDAAEKALLLAAELATDLDNVHLVAVAYSQLAIVLHLLGNLQSAVQACQQGLRTIDEMVGYRPPMSGLVLTELGNIHYDRNDLNAAQSNILEGIALAKPWVIWDALASGFVGLMQVRTAHGDWEGAFTALDDLEALGQHNPGVVLPIVEASRAKLWAAQGDVQSTQTWSQTVDLDIEGDLDYSREAEALILVRVLLAQGNLTQAERWADRLLDTAEAGKRLGRAIELYILRALVFNEQGKQDEAFESLTRALTLAEPRGFVRGFIDEGELLSSLLARVADKDLEGAHYARQLLNIGEQKADLPPSPPPDQPLVEPLSQRELEVLRLLKTELTGPEIASELSIALSTVRTHTQSIYNKLDVTNRRAAVRRAEELRLL
jgi:LuxR family maltose regulon positive regulatory protein